MMHRFVSLALAALLAAPAAASAAETRMQGRQGTAPPGSPAAAPGGVVVRSPLPPASQAVPRGSRTFARCNQEAVKRRLRGAERRHFVHRCRLGYGLRLFPRRPAHSGPSAPPPVASGQS